MFSQPGHLIETVVRGAALVAFALALVVLATHWAVRRRALAPFGWWSRFVRRWSDPLLRPVERRVAAAGGNPQDAPLWLLGAVLVAGLLAMSGVRWVLGAATLVRGMQSAGAREWLALLIAFASSVLMVAILVRVIGSWLGMGRYQRWMRPAYLLTDWLVEPIRRRLPGFGPLDLSPLLAYLLILLLRGILLGALEPRD